MNVLFYDPNDRIDVERISARMNESTALITEETKGLDRQGFVKTGGSPESLLDKVMFMDWVDCVAVALDPDDPQFQNLLDSVAKIRGRPVIGLQLNEDSVEGAFREALRSSMYPVHLTSFNPDDVLGSAINLSGDLAKACNDFYGRRDADGKSIINHSFGPTLEDGTHSFSIDQASRKVFYPETQEFDGKTYVSQGLMQLNAMQFRIFEYLAFFYNKAIKIDACMSHVVGPEAFKAPGTEEALETQFKAELVKLMDVLDDQGDLKIQFGSAAGDPYQRVLCMQLRDAVQDPSQNLLHIDFGSAHKTPAETRHVISGLELGIA